MGARPLITGALERPRATPAPEPPQVQFRFFVSLCVCLVGSCVLILGFFFLFRGDCSDICLPVRCDQNKVTGSWSP